MKVVVLYGIGGLSDVGRHAVAAALERTEIEHVTVLTQYPKHLVDETNWNCGCTTPHIFTEEDKQRMTMVTVKDWENDTTLSQHFDAADAVISCVGNRQPLTFHWNSFSANNAVIRHVTNNSNKKTRVIVGSSVGIQEDWPPMEQWKPGKIIMSAMFLSIAYPSFRDLTKVEKAYRATDSSSTTGSSIDYLIVRPVGIGEDDVPVGKWKIQKEKYSDPIGIGVAKMDVARYMVEEVMTPTKHCFAVTVGPADSTNS